MREEYNPPRYTTILIVVLLVAFVIQSILGFYLGLQGYPWLGLSVAGISRGYLWQLLTFQFLHSTPWPWHVFGNCLESFIEQVGGEGEK